MSEHTKGRLDFCVNPGVMAYELVELARPTFVVATVSKLADTRRLLAAWNFSEGLATEVIEKQTAKVALEMALEAGNNMERELAAARALQLETKKELLIAQSIIRGLIDDPMYGGSMYKHAHAQSYLYACDTPEGAPNAG